MQKILCTLPNAGTLINGIAFEPHTSGGMISVEAQPDEVVDRFLSIPGYKTPRAAKKDKEAEAAAKKAAEEAAAAEAKAAEEAEAAAAAEAAEQKKAAEEAAAKKAADAKAKAPK